MVDAKGAGKYFTTFFTTAPLMPNNLQIAENQGAKFILECVKTILNNQNIKETDFKIDINSNIQEELAENFPKLAIGNTPPRILFHVDEHRLMCARTGEMNYPGANFSKGTLETLANIDGVTVVATYVDNPNLLPPDISGVCGYPINLTPIDITRVMKELKVKDEKGIYYYPFHLPFDKKTL